MTYKLSLLSLQEVKKPRKSELDFDRGSLNNNRNPVLIYRVS